MIYILMNTKRIWDTFPSLTRAVKRSHDEQQTKTGFEMFYGHDFDHALRVADYAMKIVEDPRVGALAGAAGLCHNADRILQIQAGVGAYGEIDDNLVTKYVNEWLDAEPVGTFSLQERNTILQSVLSHSKPNDITDGDVLIALKDADRLTNIDSDILIREGQYHGDALKVVDPFKLLSDPNATYRNSGSVLRHIQEFLDWEKEGGFVGIRLPKARIIAQPRFDFLRLYLKTVIDQRKEAGLIPYPKL